MSEKSFEVFPRSPKKTYGLMELVKGTNPSVEKEPEDTIFTWPNLFYIEFIMALAITALLLFLSLYVQAPLEEEASTDTTPNPMKAPWYFLGLQELLVF
ncbi:MAG: cytochrome B6, partial [Nitrospirota bacterium]|nr:cytochrome B6 [Nitrospirota bacterium]